MARRLAHTALRVLGAWLATSVAYLLALLVPARRPAEPPAQPAPELPVVTLVPAHDEAGQIEATVRALLAQDHPRQRVVVIADNCTDATADLARAAGAEAWERRDERRGKGHALAWAIERAFATWPETGAIVLVDADCEPTPNLVSALAARVAAGQDAVQADYRVANPGASGAAARRWAGFALIHRVRGAGKDALGLSCGLFGTGMAFSADLLRRQPWESFSVTEDAEQHVRIVRAGTRVRFAAEAAVLSPMPETEEDAATQQTRWESGKGTLARETVPALVREGVARRDATRLALAGEQLVPPQSALAAGTLALTATGVVARRRRLVAQGVALATGQAAFVVGGLAVAGAPAPVWRALATAPVLIARKVPQLARVATGRGSAEWIRTRRAGE